MRSTPSLSRRYALLITVISPVLLGSYFQCVAVSNPSATTARIDELEPMAPRVGEVVHATGSGNGTPPLQFAWDFGDGDALFYGDPAAHAYRVPGTYRVTLTIRDAAGRVARDSSQVVVSPLLPNSIANLVLISDAVAGEPIQFMVMPANAEDSVSSYEWSFSDGQSAIGPLPVVTLQKSGLYVATVTVTNEVGARAVEHVAFEVVEAR